FFCRNRPRRRGAGRALHEQVGTRRGLDRAVAVEHHQRRSGTADAGDLRRPADARDREGERRRAHTKRRPDRIADARACAMPLCVEAAPRGRHVARRDRRLARTYDPALFGRMTWVSAALVARRTAAVLAAGSAVLHAVMLGHAGSAALAVLIAVMVGAC